MSRKPVVTDRNPLDASPVFQTDESAQANWGADPAEDGAGDLESGDGYAVDELLEDPAATSTWTAPAVDDPAAAPAPAAAATGAPAAPATRWSSWVWTGLGGVATLAGAVGVWMTLRDASTTNAMFAVMERVGLAPVHLFAIGLLFLGLGSATRRQARLSGHIAQLNQSQEIIGSIMCSVESATRTLQEAEVRRTDQPSSSDDVNAFRFELHRIDEKIVNLTKATRSFGTQIMEITRQLADTAHLMGAQKTAIESLTTSTESRLDRIATSLEAVHERPDGTKHVQRLATDVEALRESIAKDLATVRREVERSVESSAASLREVIAAGANATRTQVEQALGAPLQAATTELEGKIAGYGRHVRESLEALSTGLHKQLATLATARPEAGVDLSPIERTLGALQRDIAALALAGARVPSDTPASAAPAADAPSRPASGDAAPAAGVAQTIAGTRPAPSTGVRSAIAKLKQLRG